MKAERFQKEFENLKIIREKISDIVVYQKSLYHQTNNLINEVLWNDKNLTEIKNSQKNVSIKIKSLNDWIKQVNFDPSFDLQKVLSSIEKASQYSLKSEETIELEKPINQTSFEQIQVVYELEKIEDQAKSQEKKLKDLIEKGAKGHQKSSQNNPFKNRNTQFKVNNGNFEINERYRGEVLKMLKQVPIEEKDSELYEYFEKITQ